ncbi:unnamed protein product [Effrenium voratum]|nr:unnamed protein product [Effrenium voratum]
MSGGVTGLTPDPLRRLAWAERLVNGDFGLQLVDGDGSRLAVGSLNAKEPQLDLLLALPGDLQAQLPSGALLALDARALRLGLRQGNDLHFGPPLDGGLFALSAKIQGLHTEAILVTDAALQLVADYSCQLPPAEYYDISNCSGRRTASSCSLQCREAAVPQPGFARPVVKCPSEGGVFSLEGCSAPSCFLPEVPEEFDLQCGASNGPFRAEAVGKDGEAMMSNLSDSSMEWTAKFSADRDRYLWCRQVGHCPSSASRSLLAPKVVYVPLASCEEETADNIVAMATKDYVETTKLRKEWEEAGFKEEDKLSFFWTPYSRIKFGHKKPGRWVETGVTVVDEDELGQQWVTHFDVRDKGLVAGPPIPNDERWSHNWSRRKMNGGFCG